MSSYLYPPQLLHKTNERYWLSGAQAKSKLDELEAQEAAHVEELTRQVLPDAPVPVGMAGSPESTESKLKQIDESVLLAPSIQRPFWLVHREVYDSLEQRNHGQRRPLERPATASPMFSPAAMSTDCDMSMSSSPSTMNDSRFSMLSMSSPTGRAG